VSAGIRIFGRSTEWTSANLDGPITNSGVPDAGVRWTSRLISRLRHRQFGVLVSTSYVHAQAYQEIREDGHPVVILAGRDLVEILKKSGHDTAATIRRFLSESYPPPQEADHQR
jgi:hypothetical protein